MTGDRLKRAVDTVAVSDARSQLHRIAPVPASVEQLQRVPLFADLDRRELQALASSFKERRFSPGDTVAAEGAGGIGFFVINEGQAKVSVRGEDRATLGPGDYFGEIALIDEGARTATITADSDLVCYGMTSWDFRPLVEGNASIAWKLLQAMAKRLRESEQR
jgi:CRP/FNR family cyclic AMP-dependent transcriptional regulator